MLACAGSLFLGAPAVGGPIPIASYDITDAVLSGHGGWAHVYLGTITPSGVKFTNGGSEGETATYTGGGGTLSDGTIGDTKDNTQLFVAGSVAVQTGGQALISPVISLNLGSASPSTIWFVDSIEIYGGDIQGNAIPGVLTAFSVAVIGPDGTAGALFQTEGFPPGTNPVNDRVDLGGTKLAETAAHTVVLADFSGTFGNWFSITEVRVYGTLAEDHTPIPLPGTLWLLGAMLVALPLGRRRSTRRAAARR